MWGERQGFVSKVGDWWRKSRAATPMAAVAIFTVGIFAGNTIADYHPDPVLPAPPSKVKVEPHQRVQFFSDQMSAKVHKVELVELGRVRPPPPPPSAVLKQASQVGYRIGTEAKRSAGEISERTVEASNSVLRFEKVFEEVREAYCLIFAWFVVNDQNPESPKIIISIVRKLSGNLGRAVEMFPSDAADFSRELSEAKTNGEVAATVAYAVLC